MLKTTGSSDLAQRDDDDEVIEGGGNRNLSKFKKSKNVKSRIQKRLGAMGEPIFLTLDAREVFNKLRQVFIKAPILQHFDPECHIRIKTDALGYAIGKVLSQLILDHLTSDQGQWHPIAYFLKKIIPAETRYETHNDKLLAIVEAFKTWHHYLEGCKHEVLVLTDHNNLHQFMDTKSLSSDKSAGLKTSLVTIFELIIVRARQMELLTPCLNILSKIQRKKRSFELRTSKFCIAYSLRWLMPASQASALQSSYCLSIESSFVEPMFYLSFNNSETISKVS